MKMVVQNDEFFSQVLARLEDGQEEPLRRLAGSPALPRIRTGEEVREDVRKDSRTDSRTGSRTIRFPLLGLTAKDIESDGEMSVYGTAERRGALVTAAEEGSPAALIGLLPGDVIVAWNGRGIENAADLDGCTLDADAFHGIRVLRGQREIPL